LRETRFRVHRGAANHGRSRLLGGQSRLKTAAGRIARPTVQKVCGIAHYGFPRHSNRPTRSRPRAMPRLIVPLSVDEVARFWSSFRTSRDLAIVGLMLLHGLRSCEVLFAQSRGRPGRRLADSRSRQWQPGSFIGQLCTGIAAWETTALLRLRRLYALVLSVTGVSRDDLSEAEFGPSKRNPSSCKGHHSCAARTRQMARMRRAARRAEELARRSRRKVLGSGNPVPFLLRWIFA